MFLVQDGDLYFTGEWSRDELPAAYLGCLEDAAHWETREEAQTWADEFGGTVVEMDSKRHKEMITKKEHENLLAKLNIANMHLATLCDIVMGADAADRSDEALILATGSLKRKYLYLRDFLDEVDAISNRPIDASDAMDELDYLLEGIDQDKC